MTGLPAWITFRELIDSQSLAEGDASDQGQFMRKLNFAVKCYHDMHLKGLPATETVTLPIDSEQRVIVLPQDCMAVVSVGDMVGGRFRPFYKSSDMVKTMTADCGVETQVPVTTSVTRPAVRCYYSVDLKNGRVIIEAPLTVTEAVVNYTPSGVRMDGQTYIPRMCRGTIEAYIDWQMVLRDRTVSISEKKNLELEYLRQWAIFQGYQYDVDELFQEYYDHILTGKQY